MTARKRTEILLLGTAGSVLPHVTGIAASPSFKEYTGLGTWAELGRSNLNSALGLQEDVMCLWLNVEAPSSYL